MYVFTGIECGYLLTVKRITMDFLEQNDRLMVHVYKTIWKYINTPYLLIVDMSWANLTDELQAALYRAVVNFTRLMKREYVTLL